MLMTSSVIAREFVCRRGGGCSNSLKINCYFVDNYTRLETHYKCRNDYYPNTDQKVARINVAEQEVRWSDEYYSGKYEPPCYTAPSVASGPRWADPDIKKKFVSPNLHFNMFFLYNRICCGHIYSVKDNCPMNPVGRTGLRGRGQLGRWGPNQQVHAVIVRWLKDKNNTLVIHPKTNKPMFEFLTVKRADCEEWSIPGQFITTKQRYSTALKRCIVRELYNDLKSAPADLDLIFRKCNKFLSKGILIYRGYVDDPRNTDNAWVSTIAMLYIDTDRFMDKYVFSPGPSILDIRWANVSFAIDEEFYANHEDFIRDAARVLGAHYLSDIPTYEEQLVERKKYKLPTSDELKTLSFSSYDDKEKSTKSDSTSDTEKSTMSDSSSDTEKSTMSDSSSDGEKSSNKASFSKKKTRQNQKVSSDSSSSFKYSSESSSSS